MLAQERSTQVNKVGFQNHYPPAELYVHYIDERYEEQEDALA